MNTLLSFLIVILSLNILHADTQEVYDSLYNTHGVLHSSDPLSSHTKRDIALYYSYRDRAEIAMAVAFAYPGGDYFEFGSDGMGTFRNFLTAFDINDLDKKFPDTRFYAFDIFGSIPSDNFLSDVETTYFSGWENNESDKLEQAENYVKSHNLFTDRCIIVPGLFNNILTETFVSSLKIEGRKIGFAFLDCNISSSYKTCFAFIKDLMGPASFIYMDEYFLNGEVPHLFEDFVRYLKENRNMKVNYVRAAAGVGALFKITSISEVSDFDD